jgi:hypothetical protein
MSTKTNFKRVALVAVAALGLGVLTSVAPANASTLSNAAYTFSVTDNTLACAISNTGGAQTITLPVGIEPVMVASASMTSTDIVKFSSTGPLLKSFTGNVGSRTDVVSADRLTLTATAAATVAFPAKITYSALSTVGTYYIAISQNILGSATSTPIGTIKIKYVAACGNNVLSLADSFVKVDDENSTPTDNIDDTAGLTVDNGVTSHVNLALKDSLTSALTGSGVLLATATNGAVIAWDGAPTSQSSTALSTSRGGNNSLYVTQGTANAYKPLVTVVTITLDGTPIATKTITFKGIAASITMQSIEIGKKNAANTEAFKFSVKDAVGNLLAGYTPAAVASTVPSNGVISAISFADSSSSTASSQTKGGFTCLDVSGTGKIKLELTNDIGQTVTSPEYSLTCGGTIYGYTAEFDKKSYAPGEVATLTIKGTDSKGAAVHDAIVSDGAESNVIGTITVAAPGLTAVTTPSSSDTFVGGKITYRYTVGSVEGAFNAVVDPSDIDDAVTIAYTIKSSSTAVSNADVLKAIVSLIASINKQIAALQKALLKKK